MAVKVIYGDVYALLVEWLPAQRLPFLVIPNVTAGRALEDRLASEGREAVTRNLVSGRVGRLAAELVGPGEDISTIDLVVEREILRGLLPPDYRQFGAQDPFMDQVVRELDDLRRNWTADGAPSVESLLAGASVSPREREAFSTALRLMQTEAESVAGLRASGLYLGADLIREATSRLRAGTRPPWSGVAVAAVHRLDSVSRDLLLALAQVVDVVFFPGPPSSHVRSIVQAWHLPPQTDENGRSDAGSPFVRRYVLGEGTGGGPDRPSVEAFPDRNREIRGLVRAVVATMESGTSPRDLLVAAPRADRYSDAIAAVCSEFGVPYYVGGLRFYAPLPIDRFSQSLLRYLTVPAAEEGRALGELVTRSGGGFVPFRASALRDRLAARAQGPEDWIKTAQDVGWPERDVNRLQTALRALAVERAAWQSPRPAAEWVQRHTKLLSDLRIVEVLGRDLARRGRGLVDSELAWEGQGSRKYLDRIAAFGQTLAAGSRTAALSWGRMSAADFVRLYTGEVSFGSFLPSQTDASAVRFLDIEDALLQQVEHLWLIDFAEGALPLDYPRPFLIPERVREHLAQSTGILTRDRHLLLQRGNFEKVFPVPRRSLRFSYPYQDERARARLPSPFALTYGLLTGAEVESVIAQRRQAHEYFPRVPAEWPTASEAVGLVARALHSPAPASGDATGASIAGAVRGLRQTIGAVGEGVLARGGLFVNPPAVVDLAGAGGETLAMPDSMTAEALVDGARCPFRVYARTVLLLYPPRRERWPEDPLRAVEQVLTAILDPSTWPSVLQAAGPLRLRLFREAAQKAITGEDTAATRGFQEYVARQAFDYVNRIFFVAGANGSVRKPLGEAGKVWAKMDRLTVEGVVSRVDDVDGRRTAVVHVASPRAVEPMWGGAFESKAPADGGEPRPSVVALGVEKVQAVELHSLAAGGNAWERLFERTIVDRQRETKPPGEWDPKIKHLGSRFDRAASESVKVAADAMATMIDERRFEIKPRPGACDCCGLGALCQRRWLPFPEEEGRS